MLVTIAVTLCVVGVINWFLTYPYGYWKKRGVPNPSPKILVGNLGSSVTLKKNLGQIYKEIYDEYKDYLYVGYYKFRKPGIVVRDMELIKNVLVKEFSSFHDNDIHVDENIDPIFGKNPFCLTGDRWKHTRSLVISSITNAKIKNMFNLIDQIGNTMVKYIENNSESCGSEGLETKELAAKFTTDVVATCAFGLDGKSFEDPNADFRAMGRKFLMPTFWNGIKLLIIFISPFLTKIFRIKILQKCVEEWFTGVIKQAVKQRQENNIVRHDYLDLLISLKPKGFTDTDIVAQALTFYGDGIETSSTALSYILYEIAKKSEIQERLREEIDTVLKKYNGEINFEAISEMTYLHMVFTEGLRMHSPGLFIARICTKPYEFPPPKGEGTGPNVKIYPGTPIIIPIIAIHKDPSIYNNPEEFDPERFTEENKNSRPKYSFLGFGEGPRICLGSKFALAQTKAAIVHIISNFEIKVNKKTIEPLQMDPKNFIASAIGGLWLNFYNRKDK